MNEIRESKKQMQSRGIYGSFFLGDSELALSVSHVQEVVNGPTGYTPVPLMPHYLKGLLNLRGAIIPVVDLRELLEIRAHSTSEANPKVAIVELNGACMGLLFDKTGEIFNDNDDERSDFNERGSKTLISGVFKKDEGKRIIQILDVIQLFELQSIPTGVSGAQPARESLRKKKGIKKQCISFVVGPAKCALPICDIQEILKIDRLSESVLSFGHCIGTINLRGSTVPAIDFASLLGYREVDHSETATQGDRRIVVMRLGKELFGLMVDSIDSIISFFSDELLSFPLPGQNKAEMFLGCITGYGRADVLLLNHEKILTNEEVNQITRGHSRIYRDQDQGKSAMKSKGGVRQTYVTFKIGQSYAVAINELKEIIEYPQQLLQPPGVQEHVRGVLNLRGDLVTVIDARSLYLNEEVPHQIDSQKVLIFNRKGFHFGLIVDAVDSIVTFSENDKIKLPELLYRQSVGNMVADISEAVEVMDSLGIKRNMLILSSDSLAIRATQSLAAG